MPTRDPVKRKEQTRLAQARWYAKNNALQIRRNHAWRIQVQAWFADLKSSLACKRCGETHPACLEFHHDDPSIKETTLNEAIWRRNWGKDKLLAEIAKCTILCCNCHRKHHWKEKGRG